MISRKKIVICGGSDTTVSFIEKYKGTSFGEIIAKNMGWELVSLARSGCSNGCIRLQIEEALFQRPDFVIVNPTVHSRLEIPAKDSIYEHHRAEPKGWNARLDNFLKKNRRDDEGYNPSLRLENINYSNEKPYRLISEPMVMLAENEIPQRPEQIPFYLSLETRNAVKQYINYLYDSEWKLQMDRWIIRDGVTQLYFAGIPFLIMSGNMWDSSVIRSHFPSEISSKFIIEDPTETITYFTNNYPCSIEDDPGYHTTLEAQKLLAEKIQIRIEAIINKK